MSFASSAKLAVEGGVKAAKVDSRKAWLDRLGTGTEDVEEEGSLSPRGRQRPSLKLRLKLEQAEVRAAMRMARKTAQVYVRKGTLGTSAVVFASPLTIVFCCYAKYNING